MENQGGDPGKNAPIFSEVFKKQPGRKKNVFMAVSGAVSLVLLILVVSYFNFNWASLGSPQVQPGAEDGSQKDADDSPAFVLSSQFANWEDVPVSINPQVPAYVVEKDLNNVINADVFHLSDEAKQLLAKNAFVVVPSTWEEFHPLYESNRYGMLPSFITTDSMLHSYHLMFDNMLKNLEEEKLIPELRQLNEAMLADSIGQYETLKGTEWENAAKRNVAFFAVGYRLLNSGKKNIQSAGSETSIDLAYKIVKDEVEKELALIDAHQGIEESFVMNIGAAPDSRIVDTPQGTFGLEKYKEDYSQYVPRGHYTKTDDLKAYFKAMMWYGRINFRLKNEDEVKSSLLVSLALAGKNKNQESWDKVYEPINFFVGKSDDITYYDYRDIMKESFGEKISLENVTGDSTKLAAFTKLAKKLDPPQINSMPIFNSSIQPDREDEIKGFRFLGQRFTIDASIFQRLMTREVGPKGGKCSAAPFDEGRMLPKGLDIPAAMGSSEAYSILQSQGETDYACYKENMSSIQTYVSSLDKSVWTQNLYWGWLYSLKPLTEERGAGYPSFMSNSAWQRKGLNTYLGSWTELKRDTILYAKQAYAELGGGGDEPIRDDRGYVEPEPYVYARLASLIKMTKAGLDSRGLLDDDQKEDFDRMYNLAVRLKVISEKELNGEALSDDDYAFIKAYGGNLEHIWYEVFKKDGKPMLGKDTNAPVVADVATDPNGFVLEEGTGFVSTIYAVVPIDGKLHMTRGAVYSYYEFVQPMEDRLDDDKWEDLLRSNNAPALPDWTSMFTSKS